MVRSPSNQAVSIKGIPFTSILTGIYIIIWYLGVGGRIPALGAIRIEFILGALLLLFSIISPPKVNKVDSEGLVTLAFLFLFVLGLYTIFSIDRENSIDVFIDRVIKFAMLSLFLATFCRTSITLKFFIICLFIAWFKMCLEGFLGWYSGGLVWDNQGIPRLHGPTSTTAHPNSFSGFAVGTLPFILYLFPLNRKYWQKLFLLVMGGFAVVIIITTGSRTGYVATVFFLVYFMFGLKINKMKAILIILFFGILAVTFIPDSYKERFESIFTQQEAEGHSTEKRVEILEDIWGIYSAYPLGVGVGAFPAARMEMFGRHQDTHNLYLEVLTNIGPVGLLIFILLIGKILSLNRKNIRRNNELIAGIVKESLIGRKSYNSVLIEEIKERTFLIAVSKATIGFIIVRLVLGLFGMDLYEIYWWLAIGLTLSVNVITNQKRA